MAAKTASKKAAAPAPKKAAPKAAKTAPAAPKKAAKSAKKAAPAAPAAPDPAKAEALHAKDVERKVAAAEHQHQDPRGSPHAHNPSPTAHGNNPRADQGAIKNRGVPRMNKIVNWFRRGAGR